MANLSDFLPAGGGGGNPLERSMFLLGTTEDQTATFSPTDNELEVGSLIYVTLIGGGTGGSVKGSGGAPHSDSSLGGAAGGFWQGYYELTSTDDITLLAGRGGSGASQTYSSGQGFNAAGVAGNHSTLTQGGSVILSSDNSVTTSMISPSWAALTAGTTIQSDKFLNTNSTTLTIGNHNAPVYHSPLHARQGSGSGGGGALRGTYGNSGTLTAGDGGSGMIILNW
jgi:hypothetical protein